MTRYPLTHKKNLANKACQYALLLSLAALGTTAAQAAIKTGTEAHPTPIHFTKGHVSTAIEGTLPAKATDYWYQFSATKGQYTVINISAKASVSELANVGVLQFPSGAQDGTKGGIIYQGCLPETGTYKLRMARNLMATHGGKAGYHTEVVILPPSASSELCD